MKIKSYEKGEFELLQAAVHSISVDTVSLREIVRTRGGSGCFVYGSDEGVENPTDISLDRWLL